MLRSDFFYTYDYDAIAAHLEKMASRGWLIEKIGPFFWKYKKIRPQKMKFHVSYYPVSSGFDPAPTVRESELWDICGRSGWSLAARTPRMQIFSSPDPEPAPVVTDPELELCVINRRAMGGELPFAAAALAASLYMLAGLLGQLLGGIVFCGFSELSMGFMAGLLTIVAANYALELVSYPIWYFRAKKAVGRGERVPSAHISPAVSIFQHLAFLGLLAWGVSAAALSAGAERFIGLIPLLAAALLFTGADSLRQRLRQKALPSRRTRLLTTLAGTSAFALTAALFWVIM